MTYQESFATALKLKDYVRLYDKQALIYFIFSNQTEFILQIFPTEPADEIQHRIQREAFYVNKIPMACVFVHEGTETFLYRDPNVTVEFDLKDDSIIYFDGEESTPIDIKKVRKNYSKLIRKLE